MSDTRTIAQPTVIRESARGYDQFSLTSSAFTKRKIFLLDEVNDEMLDSFTMQMIELTSESSEPIDIYINSPGGVVNSGLGIYDLIQGCDCPINMYCIGMAASMAAIILAGGQKGRRFIMPHSKVMIHEPLIEGGIGGSASTIKSTADSILKTRDITNGLLAKHTGKTIEEIDKATDHDNFMTAEEAVEFGICDSIFTKI